MEDKMRLFYDFTVDGEPILVPAANVKIDQNDLDSDGSGRDEQGYMHRIVLRRRVKKWGFSYSTLTQAEYDYINSLFDGKDTFTFAYTEKGEKKTTSAYCSSNSVSLYNAKKGIYKGFSFNIIEC